MPNSYGYHYSPFPINPFFSFFSFFSADAPKPNYTFLPHRNVSLGIKCKNNNIPITQPN